MKELIEELEKELNQLGTAWNQFGKVDRMKSTVKKMKNSYAYKYTIIQLWRLAIRYNNWDDFEMMLNSGNNKALSGEYEKEIYEASLENIEQMIKDGTAAFANEIKKGKLSKINGKWFVDYLTEQYGDNNWHYCIPIYELENESEQVADLKLVEMYNVPVSKLNQLDVEFVYAITDGATYFNYAKLIPQLKNATPADKEGK